MISMIRKRLRCSYYLNISIISFHIYDKRTYCASITIHRWSSDEVAPLKNRHRCRMHETSRARNIARNASRVAVSPRDVSRNMRALEEPADKRGSLLSSYPLSPFHAIRKKILRKISSLIQRALFSSEKRPVPRDFGLVS